MSSLNQEIRETEQAVEDEKRQGVQDGHDYTNNSSYVKSMHSVLSSFKTTQAHTLKLQQSVNSGLAQACAPKHQYTNPQADDAKLMKHVDAVFE